MACEREAVRLGIRENGISFAHARKASTDNFTRTMLLVFNHCDDWDLQSHIGKHSFSCFFLYPATINDYDIRKWPLRMIQPP